MIGLGLQEQHVWLKGLVGSLVALNLLDGLLTLNWIHSGMATEINPLMAVLLNTNPFLFMLIKTLLVGLGAFVLWRLRSYSLAVSALYLCCMVYLGVIFYHLGAGWYHLS